MAKGTPKDQADLNNLYPDNTSGQISPSDARDLVASSVTMENTIPVRPFGDSDTRANRASAVDSAITHATNNGFDYVLVGEDYLDYDASSVTFDNSVKMVREGQVADVFDVKAYGAAGDSTTDDTAALQAAIDQAGNSGEPSIVFVPQGHFVFTSITVKDPVLLVGGGWSVLSNDPFGNANWDDDTRQTGSVLDCSSTSGIAVDVPLNQGDSNHERLDVRDIMILGPGSGDSKGLRIKGTQHRLEQVLIANFDLGVELDNVPGEAEFHSLRVRGCDKGVHLRSAINNNRFTNLEIQHTQTFGLKLGSSTGGTANFNQFDLGLFQGSKGSGDGIQIVKGEGNTFRGWWFESGITGSEIFMEAASTDALLRGNVFEASRFTNNSTSVPEIKLNGASSGEAQNFNDNVFRDLRGIGPADLNISSSRVFTTVVERVAGFNITDNGMDTVRVELGDPYRIRPGGRMAIRDRLEIENPGGAVKLGQRWAGGSSNLYQLSVPSGGEWDLGTGGAFGNFAIRAGDDGAGNSEIAFHDTTPVSQTVNPAFSNTPNTGSTSTDALITAMKNAILDHGLGST